MKINEFIENEIKKSKELGVPLLEYSLLKIEYYLSNIDDSLSKLEIDIDHFPTVDNINVDLSYNSQLEEIKDELRK